MQYPVRVSRHWADVGQLSLSQKVSLVFRNARFRRRRNRINSVEVRRVGAQKPAPNANSIVLLCIVKNAGKFLPSLLAHYRRLGISRFAFVDDRSTDRTRELLLREPDVDLYESDASFREAAGGLAWRDKLVELYGRDRWYVSIDADEYLVFPGSEKRSIHDFIEDLTRRGYKRSLAMMLDMYPDGAIGAKEASALPESLPVSVSPLHDGSGYRIEDEKFCTAIRGGPRHRRFDVDMRLTKFPVVFADAGTMFAGGSHHGPLPIHRNFSPVQAVLLHFKFAPGAVAEFQAIAERGTHYNGSAYYRRIIEHEDFGAETDFRYDRSERYEDSERLVERGFMQDLRSHA